MYTVSELVKVSKNNSRALVIYLATSFGRKTGSGKMLEDVLGTLGRNLGTSGGVVVSFEGDEDAILRDLLKKPWTEKQSKQLQERPGILIIDKNFEEFDPRADNFFHINLNSLFNSIGTLDERGAEKFVIALHQIFLGDNDLFEELERHRIVLRRDKVASAISLKPGLYGIGVDVRAFVKALGI